MNNSVTVSHGDSLNKIKNKKCTHYVTYEDKFTWENQNHIHF